MHHWVPLLDYFDAYLESQVKGRRELGLEYEAAAAAAQPPFPSEGVLAVLRATAAILEHCSNKHLYNSYEVRRGGRGGVASAGRGVLDLPA